MDLLKETYRVWALHREFRTVLAELNGYTDRELAELGLGRADIVRVAYEEAERRIGAPSPARRAAAAAGGLAWASPGDHEVGRHDPSPQDIRQRRCS